MDFVYCWDSHQIILVTFERFDQHHAGGRQGNWVQKSAENMICGLETTCEIAVFGWAPKLSRQQYYIALARPVETRGQWPMLKTWAMGLPGDRLH